MPDFGDSRDRLPTAMSVTIEVPIPYDLIPRLEQKARHAGLDRE